MDFKTSEEFLLALSEALKYLHPKDTQKVLNYYNTRINNSLGYGQTLEQVLNSLPTIEEIAKDTYESHGVDYLSKRKKLLKRKAVVNKIIDTIILTIMFIAFLVIMYGIYYTSFNGAKVIIQLFKLKNITDIVVSSLGMVAYTFTLILLSIYVIDLFYILSTHFITNLLDKLEQPKKVKILSFTLNGLLDQLFKKKNILFKSLVTCFICTIFFTISSFVIKGYVYRSLSELPSNKLEISLLNKNMLNINTDNTEVYVTKSDNGKCYGIYEYEFKDDIKITTSDDIINIDVPKSSSYDLLNIYKEPLNKLTIYIPDLSTINLTLNTITSNLTIDEVDLKDVKVEAKVSSTIIVSKSNLNTLMSDGYNITCGISSSSIDEVNLKECRKQFVIEKNTTINKLNVISNALLKIEDATINEFNLINVGKDGDIKNVKGNTFSFISSTCKTYLSNLEYQTYSFEVSKTGLINLSDSTGNTIKANVNSSYYTLDNVTTSNVLIEGISANLTLFKTTTSPIIKNSGPTSKINIEQCKLKDIDVNQTNGFIILSNSEITKGKVVGTNSKIVEFLTNTGTSVDIYLHRVEEYTKFTESTLIYNIIKADDYSIAGISKEGNVTINDLRGENNDQ